MKRYVELFENWQHGHNNPENTKLAIEIAKKNGVEAHWVNVALKEIEKSHHPHHAHNANHAEHKPAETEGTTTLGMSPLLIAAASIVLPIVAGVLGAFLKAGFDAWQDTREENRIAALRWLENEVRARIAASGRQDKVKNQELAQHIEHALMHDKALKTKFNAMLRGKQA